jgi:hypothetical protein
MLNIAGDALIISSSSSSMDDDESREIRTGRKRNSFCTKTKILKKMGGGGYLTHPHKIQQPL